MSSRFQYHVYQLAAKIAEREKLITIADVGCGPGTKLAAFFPSPYEVHGFDLPEAIDLCQRHCRRGKFTAIDFSLSESVESVYGPYDLVVCADVVEHLEDPCGLFSFLCSIGNSHTTYVISTPDRIRLHGRDVARPSNPAHVREWTASEFVGFVESMGLEVREQRFLPAQRVAFDQASIVALCYRLIRNERAYPNQVLICTLKSSCVSSL